jgi:glutathione S-transferase
MTLYDFALAPSPRRARILIAEKGLTVDTVQIDLTKGEQLAPEFRAINPCCTVPALKLDDGTVLNQNVAIALYLEETHPEPPLLGTTPVERALVMNWNQRVEFEGLMAVAEVLRNRSKAMQGRALTGPDAYEQIPALAERGMARLKRFFDTLDEALEGREFLATGFYSFADITAFVTVDFAKWVKAEPEERHANLRRWFAAAAARPSASA